MAPIPPEITIKDLLDQQAALGGQITPQNPSERIKLLETAVQALVDGVDTLGSVKAGSRDYASTSTGADVLISAATGLRAVVVVGTVLETFANATGAQPTFKVGDVANDARFVAAAELTGKAVGSKIVGAGIVSSGEAVRVTATAGTEDATGAVRFTAFVVGL